MQVDYNIFLNIWQDILEKKDDLFEDYYHLIAQISPLKHKMEKGWILILIFELWHSRFECEHHFFTTDYNIILIML